MFYSCTESWDSQPVVCLYDWFSHITAELTVLYKLSVSRVTIHSQKWQKILLTLQKSLLCSFLYFYCSFYIFILIFIHCAIIFNIYTTLHCKAKNCTILLNNYRYTYTLINLNKMTSKSSIFEGCLYTALWNAAYVHVLWPKSVLSCKLKCHYYCLKHWNETSYKVWKCMDQHTQ